MQFATNRASLGLNESPSVNFPPSMQYQTIQKYSPNSGRRNQDLPLENYKCYLSAT